MSSIPKGTWVEVERVALGAGQRPPVRPSEPGSLPPRGTRVSGFLLKDGELGQMVRIRTITGKEHVGSLRIQNPGYGYGFAHAVPELLRALPRLGK